MQGRLSVYRRPLEDEALLVQKWLSCGGFEETAKVFAVEHGLWKRNGKRSSKDDQAQRPIVLEHSEALTVTIAAQIPSNLPSDSLELFRNTGANGDLFTSPPGFESPQSSRHKRKRGTASDATSHSSGRTSSATSEPSEGESKQDIDHDAADTPEQGSSKKSPDQKGPRSSEEEDAEPPKKKTSPARHRKIEWLPQPPSKKTEDEAERNEKHEKKELHKSSSPQQKRKHVNGTPDVRMRDSLADRPKYETLCRYYARGECNRGDRCEWSHDVIDKSSPQTERELAAQLEKRRARERRVRELPEIRRSELLDPKFMLRSRPPLEVVLRHPLESHRLRRSRSPNFPDDRDRRPRERGDYLETYRSERRLVPMSDRMPRD